MASVSKDKMKVEALRRLEALAVNGDALNAFEGGKIYRPRGPGRSAYR